MNNSISGGCYDNNWKTNIEPHSFPAYLQANGYTTFFAGKYLNQVYCTYLLSYHCNYLLSYHCNYSLTAWLLQFIWNCWLELCRISNINETMFDFCLFVIRLKSIVLPKSLPVMIDGMVCMGIQNTTIILSTRMEFWCIMATRKKSIWLMFS